MIPEMLELSLLNLHLGLLLKPELELNPAHIPSFS